MALPSSGPLSFSAIAGELGVSLSNVSLRNMSATAGFSTPDAVSEFYGYSALTYDYLGNWATDDPCINNYIPIFLGSNGIYYAYYNNFYYQMFQLTNIWFEYLYYEPAFGANVYQQWEIDNTSTVLTDLGLYLSEC